MIFERWANHVLKWEGGIADDSDDSGGLTNKGVTYTLFQALADQVLGDSSMNRFRNLSDRDAKAFMANRFTSISANRINYESIAAFVAEIAWMSGPGIAGSSLQRVLNKLGGNLKVDGAIGPLTRAELAKHPEHKVFNALVNYRRQFLEDLIKRRPKDEKYRNGWFNRLDAFVELFRPTQTRSGVPVLGKMLLGMLFLKIIG